MITISGNDYVKYVTETFVSYIDLPSEEKKVRKRNKRSSSLVWSNRWLGVLPFALKYYRKKLE
ncbi:YqzE family protein [Virgibacillus byunsanensis]|uniref:YqzE family protein n=1 Tax=Virgibacillus byunsanensis TaxID=570945 RepID=A0ABW3LMJ2_9BACI